MNTKPNPTMQPCQSSQIKAHGHCAATNTLRVEFANGGTYDYHGVTPGQYDELRKADSVSKHLHAHIKPKHKFTKHANHKE